MTQRTVAAMIALPLVLALVILAWVLPLPYTIYRPGPTVNVLAKVQVNPKDHPVYPDTTGEISMTTVNETLEHTDLGMWSLLDAWFDRDAAVYPRSVAYPTVQSDQQNQQQGQVQMTTAQDTAAQVALQALGYKVFRGAKLASVLKGSPAAGHLRAGDVITKVATTPTLTSGALQDTIQALAPNKQVTFTFLRDGKTMTTRFAPEDDSGITRIGVTVGADQAHMPFKVNVDIPSDIGGPSAGLMMTLAIYDYLTPGSLSGGQRIAGTGEIATDGAVGQIGGIQQKIAGAMHSGAKLFLVPADNCEDVIGADNGSMRLVKVSTMEGALSAIEAWVKDPNATLPTCGSGS
jgi:Lon-like protease